MSKGVQFLLLYHKGGKYVDPHSHQKAGGPEYTGHIIVPYIIFSTIL
jgi:hypothetical protein